VPDEDVSEDQSADLPAPPSLPPPPLPPPALPQPPLPPSASAPRRPNRLVISAVAVLSAAGLVWVWITALGEVPGQRGRPTGPPRHHVEYRVSGTGHSADLIYISPAGVLEERSEVPVPLGSPHGDPVIRLDMPSGTYVSIAAQARDAHPVDLTCELFVDGRRVHADRAAGHYALVDCAAVIP
jgi:hypothetical protein